jgi:predicted RNA-binding Zn-ribbon protein involved in translation (DUF1610 family)
MLGERPRSVMPGQASAQYCIACGMKLGLVMYPWYQCHGCGGTQLLRCVEVGDKRPAPVLYVPPLINIVS